jgi:hypothetical protein
MQQQTTFITTEKKSRYHNTHIKKTSSIRGKEKL